MTFFNWKFIIFPFIEVQLFPYYSSEILFELFSCILLYFQALTNYFKEIQQALPFNRGQRNRTFLILTYSARHYNSETYDVTN